MLSISCMKIMVGSSMYRETLDVVNIICSEKFKIYSDLNTQTAQSIMDFAAEASSKILQNGEKI